MEEFEIYTIVSETSITEGSSASFLHYHLLELPHTARAKVAHTRQTKYVQMKSDFNPIKSCQYAYFTFMVNLG